MWKFTPISSTYKVQIDNHGKQFIIGSLREGNPQLSPHFHANEFACPDCKWYKIAVLTLEGLEELRELAGVPLTVAKTTLLSKVNPGGSGFRCRAHNMATPNASPNSKHMDGYAVDVHPEGISVKKLYELAEETSIFSKGGIGLYKTFIHCDIGRKRRWNG